MVEILKEKNERNIDNVVNFNKINEKSLFSEEKISLGNNLSIQYSKEYNVLRLTKDNDPNFVMNIWLDEKKDIKKINQFPNESKKNILEILNSLEKSSIIKKGTISKIEGVIESREIQEFVPTKLNFDNKVRERDVFNEKPWWEKHQYTKKDFFEVNSNITRREKDKYYDIGELTQIISGKSPNTYMHFFMVPGEISSNFIPTGRIGYGLERDEKYYENAKKAIGNKNQNTLFFNYTGHSGSIAAALAEQNIPLTWQQFGNERSINSLQDWIEPIRNNNNSNNTNGGIMLEPVHGPFDIEIDIKSLPSPQEIKNNGIKKVVILTENKYGEEYTVDNFLGDIKSKNHLDFQKYLKNLEENGITVEIRGLEYK